MKRKEREAKKSKKLRRRKDRLNNINFSPRKKEKEKPGETEKNAWEEHKKLNRI
jgi:hypothetical protein